MEPEIRKHALRSAMIIATLVVLATAGSAAGLESATPGGTTTTSPATGTTTTPATATTAPATTTTVPATTTTVPATTTTVPATTTTAPATTTKPATTTTVPAATTTTAPATTTTPTPAAAPNASAVSPDVQQANNSPALQVLRSLDGSGNNADHPDWGQAGTQYARVAPPNYADGVGSMVGGPPPRRISNRIFNDLGQNIFSENNISQWGWAWGQFIDHDMDLRDETPGEAAPIPFDQKDPLERFTDDVGQIDFFRTPAAPGTGADGVPRQQINTISSFIDASQVYGTDQSRLDWLTARNGFDLMLPGNYLPKVTDKAGAPPMDLMGQLVGNPNDAIVAGDVRANENFALTSIQTLFAREHNRIADSLPAPLAPALKFQIARRIVGAEIEYITYTQFLPALGVHLDAYQGYDKSVNPSVSNEFATVGFRAHSMVHGEFEPTVPAGTYSQSQLQAFHDAGITLENNSDGTITLVIPLTVAFGNPDLVQQIGLGPALQSLDEREYKNDEQIDDSLRSTLFEVPKPGVTDPTVCGEPVVNPSCFSDVSDLGADDIQRGRDHGMPSYNDLRQAYGLPRVRRFTDITGESTDSLPKGMTCDDPRILAFTSLTDENGNPVPIGDPDNATSGVRASTLAARLRCLYRNVNNLDAFVGMVSEQHVGGTEFGQLQLAIWKQQFTALRDGDRFFYANDPALPLIKRLFGIDYQHSLGDLVTLDTGASVPDNVFVAGN
jgi:Animal haem peroxidase